MSDDSEQPRYGIVRGLFMSLCMFLIIASLIRSCASMIRPTPKAAAAPPPPAYQRQFCDQQKTHDYSDKNPERIVIKLQEGCYGDHTILPRAWRIFEPQHST